MSSRHYQNPSAEHPVSSSGMSDDLHDSLSITSRSALNAGTHPLHGQAPPAPAPESRHVQIAQHSGNPSYSAIPQREGYSDRPPHSRNTSWDIFGNIKKFEDSYEHFDSRNASTAHLQFAQGDVPNTKISRLYHYLLNVSIVTRWALFIVPVLAILWIPGILGLTAFHNARLWATKLIWWSIWLSVLWGGWWAALVFSFVFPPLLRITVGVISVVSRRYIDWLVALHRYVALVAWAVAVWVSWLPLIQNNQENPSTKDGNAVKLIGRILFAIFLCAVILGSEKLLIQFIAFAFHERSYAERIADQEAAIEVLTVLYQHSSEIPGRTDTLKDKQTRATKDGSKILRNALRGIRGVATTTTTALGNVASEMTGVSLLQPNSPRAMVLTALESANKTRMLARRLFYSFRQAGAEYLLPMDIAHLFKSREELDKAFALLDQDGNGDASRDELEMACMSFHREQLSIEHSMRDVDSAVGRLDNIFMSLYVVIAALVVAIALEAQLATLVTGAGTLILGLSWLIGGSMQEVLTSIIFLFIKHPFDVGDRVAVGKDTYTVKEIRILTTTFVDGSGCQIQAPNIELNKLFLLNMRRSGQMSETFTFDVAFSTTFEQVESLRTKMLAFVKSEKRDYLSIFDVEVLDFAGQEKLTLKADIKYKSNSQQGALKAKRRNLWVMALKTSMAELGIFGPAGNPHVTAPKQVTLVPWEEKEREPKAAPPKPVSPTGFQLTDRNAPIVEESQDVFDESDELRMTNPRPRQGESRATGASTGRRTGYPDPNTGRLQPPITRSETYEMTPQGPSMA